MELITLLGGNWLKTHKILEDKSVVNAFEELALRNRRIVHCIHLDGYDSYHQRALGHNLSDLEKTLDRQKFNKMKWIFDSCMIEAVIDSVGVGPLVPLLREIQDLYPITATKGSPAEITREAMSTNCLDLSHTLAFLSKINVNVLFRFAVYEEPKNPDKISLQIFQSGLTMPSKEYYKQMDTLSASHDTVVEILNFMLPKMHKYISINTARLNIELETRLASISDLSELLEDPAMTYNPMTILQLTELSSSGLGTIAYVSITKTAPVIALLPRHHRDIYLRELSTHVLGNSTKSAIRAYLLCQAISEYTPALGEEIQSRWKLRWQNYTVTNARVTKPRWNTCLDQVDDTLGFLAGR